MSCLKFLNQICNFLVATTFFWCGQQSLKCSVATHREIHPYNGSFFFFLLSWPTLQATLGVLELPTIIFISLICSHIEVSHLTDFTDFGASFVFIFIKGGHIEMAFENANSWTLVFKVILPHTSSCENLLNNASTLYVRVKSP